MSVLTPGSPSLSPGLTLGTRGPQKPHFRNRECAAPEGGAGVKGWSPPPKAAQQTFQGTDSAREGRHNGPLAARHPHQGS